MGDNENKSNIRGNEGNEILFLIKCADFIAETIFVTTLCSAMTRGENIAKCFPPKLLFFESKLELLYILQNKSSANDF